MHSTTFSGIDIQNDYLSIVQYNPEENSVAPVAIQPFESPSAPSLIGNAMTELKNLKGKFQFSNSSVICSFPSEMALIRRMMVDEAIGASADVIKWELALHLNDTVEDFVYDHQETGMSRDGAKEILVAAFRQKLVLDLTAALKKIKITPAIVDIDAFALVNTFEINYPEMLPALSVIIHGEAESAKIILSQNGMFRDYSWIHYGHVQNDPAAVCSLLTTEIQRLCAFNSASAPSTQIYLSGSLFVQKSYFAQMQNFHGSVEMLDPFRKIGCRIGIDDQELKNYTGQLAVAVGLAVRGSGELQ